MFPWRSLRTGCSGNCWLEYWSSSNGGIVAGRKDNGRVAGWWAWPDVNSGACMSADVIVYVSGCRCGYERAEMVLPYDININTVSLPIYKFIHVRIYLQHYIDMFHVFTSSYTTPQNHISPPPNFRNLENFREISWSWYPIPESKFSNPTPTHPDFRDLENFWEISCWKSFTWPLEEKCGKYEGISRKYKDR